MPPLRHERVRHATLLFCAKGVNVRMNRRRKMEKLKMKNLIIMLMMAFAAMFPSLASESSYGPFTPGEKVTIKIPELIDYTAKKLPSGLKLDKKTGSISGTTKKPGTYEVTFMKKGMETITTTFVVSPFPTISISMEGDTEKCKVTGASKPGKGYLVGKKVSISAKAPKGTAFTGWFNAGKPWPSEAEHLNAKQKYVMTAESLSLVARFNKEKMSVSCPRLSSPLVVGDAVSIPIEIETQSGVKSVKGVKFPTGLTVKKVNEIWSVVGAPKKKGTYSATIKVIAKSGAVEELSITVVVGDSAVAVLPNWATGTFVCYSYIQGYDRNSPYLWDWNDRHVVSIDASGNLSSIDSALGETMSNASWGNLKVIGVTDEGSILAESVGSLLKGEEWNLSLEISPVVVDGVVVGKIAGRSWGKDEDDDPYDGEFVGFQNMWGLTDSGGSHPKFAYGTESIFNMKHMVDLLKGGKVGKFSYGDMYGGFLALKYGESGAVEVEFRETTDGAALAKDSTKLMPYGTTESGKLKAMLVVSMAPPKPREPFDLVLWLSIVTPDASILLQGADVQLDDHILNFTWD